MNNRTVAENWRQQTNKAKNGSSMYYEGNVIFSYGPHFPMALLTSSTYNGKAIVLQNAYTYSNSTAKHLNHMRPQCYSDAVVKMPTDLLKRFTEALEYKYTRDSKAELKNLTASYINGQIKESEGKMARARKLKDFHASNIEEYKVELDILASL